jgi:hypothetical protein
MSFGAFTLFNFYQQPNSGKAPPSRSDLSTNYPDLYNRILEGYGRSGEVADFNWTFPYAGTLTPFILIQGGGAAYGIQLFSDSVSGARFASITQNISGIFYGGAEQSSFSSNISGAFNPVDIDTGIFNLNISGLISGSPLDANYNFINISGAFSGISLDYPNPSILLSGDARDSKSDINSINYNLSGIINSGQTENNFYKINISGKFIPSYNDQSNISYNFSGFSTGISFNIVTNTNSDDISNIRYGFLSYFSSI